MKRSEFMSIYKDIVSNHVFDALDKAEKNGLIEPDKKPSKLQEARGYAGQLEYGNPTQIGLETLHDKYESVIKEYQEVLKEAKEYMRGKCQGNLYCKIKELIED